MRQRLEPTVPTHTSPETLVRDQLAELSVRLPAVRDGDDDAIHDARVGDAPAARGAAAAGVVAAGR